MHALTLTAVIALALAGAWAHHRTTNRLECIVATQDELNASVDELNKALGEIRTLVDALNQQIVDLQAAVDAGNTLDLTGLTAVAGQLDDIVPDAPTP